MDKELLYTLLGGYFLAPKSKKGDPTKTPLAEFFAAQEAGVQEAGVELDSTDFETDETALDSIFDTPDFISDLGGDPGEQGTPDYQGLGFSSYAEFMDSSLGKTLSGFVTTISPITSLAISALAALSPSADPSVSAAQSPQAHGAEGDVEAQEGADTGVAEQQMDAQALENEAQYEHEIGDPPSTNTGDSDSDSENGGGRGGETETESDPSGGMGGV